MEFNENQKWFLRWLIYVWVAQIICIFSLKAYLVYF